MRLKYTGVLFDYKGIFWTTTEGVWGSKWLEVPVLDLSKLPDGYSEYARYCGKGIWSLKFLKYAQIANSVYYKMVKHENT